MTTRIITYLVGDSYKPSFATGVGEDAPNISSFKGTFEDVFPLPKVGYVSSVEGISSTSLLKNPAPLIEAS